MSMIRFTHSIWTAFRGESCRERRRERIAPPKPPSFHSLLHEVLALLRPSPAAPYLRDAGAREGHDDSHNVNGQLELQEFGDAVVDVASPHHRLDDAGEIIIRQDDVRSLLRHICPCNALEDQGESDGVSHEASSASLSTQLCFFPETALRGKIRWSQRSRSQSHV